MHVDVCVFHPCVVAHYLKCGALQSYSKISSGTCSSNGLFPITTLTECAAAAAAIGNANTNPGTTRNSPRPEGCYVERNELWFAGDTDGFADADGSQFPICQDALSGANVRTLFLAYSRLHPFCSMKVYVGPINTIFAMLSRFQLIAATRGQLRARADKSRHRHQATHETARARTA